MPGLLAGQRPCHYNAALFFGWPNSATALEEESWPEYVEELTKDSTIEVPVQVNGKVRDKILAGGKPLRGRPGASMPAADFKQTATESTSAACNCWISAASSASLGALMISPSAVMPTAFYYNLGCHFFYH